MRSRRRPILHYPDLTAWRAEPDYSAPVASALRAAYHLLDSYPDSLAAAYKAYAIASSHVRREMSVQQRMNLRYILARSLSEIGEPELVFEMLDCALEISTQLHDRGSTAELLYLSGRTKRAYMQPHEAIWDLRASRNIIDDLRGSEFAAAPLLELNVAFASAAVALFQARYRDALRLLDEASRLRFAAQHPDLEQDRIAWMRAVALRYLGHAEAALPILAEIAERLDAMPTTASFVRVHAVLADVALDLAERARDRGEEGSMTQLLIRAQTHARKGIERSNAVLDQGGAMLAQLALVRQSQFVEDSDTRRRIIAEAWRFAEKSDEYDIMAQARIALARELVAHGDVTAAQSLLRQIIARSAVSPVPFTGEPAKALLRRIGGYDDW